MAVFRTGTYAGRPHYWCDTCDFDSDDKAVIEGRVCDRCPSALRAAVAPAAEPPGANATRAVWAAYAAAHGVDTTDLTRDQIQAALNSNQGDPE